MKRSLAFVVAIALLVLVLVSCSQLNTPVAQAGGGGGLITQGDWPSTQPTQGLVVVGVGQARAEPEMALVSFGVEARGAEPAPIVNETSTKVNAAISGAMELGVPAEKIRTTGYNLWVETVYDQEKGVPTGEVIYHVSHQLEATLDDLDQVGRLVAAVVEAGANTINSVSFVVEDSDALVREARQLAIQDAKDKGSEMASGLGISLGKPILVTETSGGYPLASNGIGGGGGIVPAPMVSPGTFEVTVSVQVIYQIQ